MVAIEHIETRAVREVCMVYKHFYATRVAGTTMRVCGCSPDTGTWPHNFLLIDGWKVPVMCGACEWIDKQGALQRLITGAGLSMPLPLKFNNRGEYDKLIKDLESRKIAGSNPILTSPHFMAVSGADPHDAIGHVTRWLTANHREDTLHNGEHIVFLVHRSQAINLTFRQREQEIEDVLMYAPILVYWDNDDGRNHSRIMALIKSRQYGLAVIVK